MPMCFHSEISKSAQELEHRFNVKFDDPASFSPAVYNGFNHPKTPVITNLQPDIIKLYHWGLIPFWAKDDKIKKNTLNARIETIHEKPSFRNVVNKRCLIIADGFFEWQWMDEKGRQKQKYELTFPSDEVFAFAGLWSEWVDKSTGEIRYTYTIITTEANELMSKIHNSKKRMPVIVERESEQSWLKGGRLMRDNDKLRATKI